MTTTLYAVSNSPDVVLERVNGVWADMSVQPSWGSAASPGLATGFGDDQIVVHGNDSFHHFNGSAWVAKSDGLLAGSTCERIFRLPGSSVFYAGLRRSRTGYVGKYESGSWTIVNSFSSAFGSKETMGLWASSESDVWMSARSSTGSPLYLWHWDGVSWTNRWSEVAVWHPGVLWGTALNDVYFATWHGGSSQSQVHHWDGASWTLNVHSTTGTIGRGDMWAANSSNIWYASASLFTGNTDVWRGPGTWTKDLALTSKAGGAARLAGVSTNEIYMSTRNSSAQGEVFEWNGTTWTQHADAILATRALVAIAEGAPTPTPSVINQSPVCDATQVSQALSQVSFDVYDTLTSVIKNTIDAYIDGTPVYIGATDTFVSPWDGAGSSITDTTVGAFDGYSVVLDYTGPAFSSYQLITVRSIAQNTETGTLDEYWSFNIEDVEEPLFTNFDPEPGETNVLQDSYISLDMYDKGSGVDTNTVEAYVQNTLAYRGDTNTFISPYAGPGSSFVSTMVDGYDGYRLTIDPENDFKSLEVTSVFIKVDDMEGN